jgi:hypothetical protein
MRTSGVSRTIPCTIAWQMSAVERILMKVGKPGDMEGGFFVDRQQVGSEFLPIHWIKAVRCVRQFDLSVRIFDRNLPT